MREIKYIVIHCTAGPQDQSTDELFARWKSKGWKNPGYHKVVDANGQFQTLAKDANICNGVEGYNSKSIHISYKGGWSGGEDGHAVDNRTPQQKKTLRLLVHHYHRKFPNAKILGHRDFSPDKDGDGVVEKPEWIKACPSFEVKDWLKEIGL
ncbi:MAG: N-acetylmuramoyl-L-alanine amidase [Flavobacteriales bacterium]|nr:N-acetylmuramoyl-L-alanine amidase [Flavobacteriales bacterium]